MNLEKPYRKQISALAVLPDNRRVISRDLRGGIKIWDLHDGSDIFSRWNPLNILEPSIDLVLLDSDRFVTVGHSEHVRVWDCIEASQVNSRFRDAVCINQLAKPAIDHLICCVSDNHLLSIWMWI